MTSATRELLAERYRLDERIATGGMGVIWRARDLRLDRDVAIKLIRPEYADDPTFRQRLELEARATAAIRSPHVVRLHDVYEHPDPDGGYQAFLVMELVDGQPLSAVLHGGALTARRTADVLKQAAAALAAAHEQQIVHRDIKPGNLMLDAHDRLTVLDFGIARAADTVALTATNFTLGTPRYISAEQAAGDNATSASDVYSLGVVTYECLAGKVPFDAPSDVAVALAHLRDAVPPLPADAPAPLASLVMRMLTKAPAGRPTAQQIVDSLTNDALTAPMAVVSVPAPTVVMPVGVRARQVLRHRLAGRDLKEAGSAPLPAMAALPTGIVLAGLLLIAAVTGSPARATQPPTHTNPNTAVNPVNASTTQQTKTKTKSHLPTPTNAEKGPAGPGPAHAAPAGPAHLPPGQAKKQKRHD